MLNAPWNPFPEYLQVVYHRLKQCFIVSHSDFPVLHSSFFIDHYILNWHKRHLPHVEQELLTHSERFSPSPIFSWVRGANSFNFLFSVLETIVCLFAYFRLSMLAIASFVLHFWSCVSLCCTQYFIPIFILLWFCFIRLHFF